MEKLLLSGFLSYNKLDVVNQKNVDVAVTVTERIDQGNIVGVSQCVDQFVRKCFG